MLVHYFLTGDKLSENFLYENINSIRVVDDTDACQDNGIAKDKENNEDVQGRQKAAELQLLPGLINSVPVNQRPAVSAILRQRQAQRIRSKSVVHHDVNIPKEGKVS